MQRGWGIIRYLAPLLYFVLFASLSFSCFAFHFTNFHCPPSLSKSACIFGRRIRAKASTSWYDITLRRSSFCNDFIWHSTSGGQCEIIIINYNCGSSSPNNPIFLRKFQCPIPQFIGKRTTATAFNNFSALYLLTALSLLNSCRYAAPQVLFQADTQCSIRHTARQYPQNIPLSH